VPRRRSTLLALLALAAALRVARWALYTDVIENEGVEYTRLAWNWFHGRGYVSIFGGTHTAFPPIYPLLIGLAAPLAGSEEAAARLVSVVAGVALVGAVVGLARRVFDERIALLSGALAACHPLLVALSSSTYSEGLFLALSTGCTLAAVRTMERPTAARAALVGVLAGLAYLTRPEGIALAAAFGGLVLLAGWVRRRTFAPSLLHAGAVIAVAGLVAAPYVAHLSRIAGGFRWEGKSWTNNAITLRLRQGLGYQEAARGLGPDAEPLGPFLFSDQHAQLAAPAVDGTGLVAALLADPVGRAAELAETVVRARPLGSPLVLALALVGIVATPWWRTRVFEGAALLAVPALGLAVLLSLQFTWERYLLPLLPAGLVWAAAGADRIGRWSTLAAVRLGLPARLSALAGPVAAAGLALGVLVLAARGVTDVGEFSQTRHADVREAGRWIRADYAARGRVARPKIAGIGLALAHYAGGEEVYLPAADEPRALRFLHRVRPDYLALRDSEIQQTSYAPDWYAGRVADACAQPVADLPAAAAAHFRIWRWSCGGAEGATESQ
jgi:4-amino-4-deoxy-L-arabinose transferase-like glycosyltransferase